jgi:hypothetical protein
MAIGNIYCMERSDVIFIGVGKFSGLGSVIPAKAGIQKIESENLDARLRGHDGKKSDPSIK